MRGNWNQSEPLALTPESRHIEFQQQQQQSPPPPLSPDKPSLDSSSPTLAKQQHQQQEVAAYPITTPAWADLVVKEEPQDEKNNDSGISPGHYTSDTASQHSDNSMMVGVNGFSPNSASSTSPEPRLQLDVNSVSNGSSNMKESAYDYSSHLHDLQQSDGSSIDIPSPENLSHDVSPPTQHDNSKNHIEGLNGTGNGVNESIEQPIVNSQGKIKTFTCKQCKHVFTTKVNFWTHIGTHIKPEKLLMCTKCPFVTEYKHHLEYHLLNHVGSKPYKCEKCEYSCVNKSMLNSHLKSHSNIYQFRCADCSYATKYCHSLKLHLRKYQHEPAMVLNADGSPNPLPIIDVYGTRRGPKTKPKKKPTDEQQQQQATQAQPQQSEQQQQPLPQQQSPPLGLVNSLLPTVLTPTLMPQFQFNAMNGINAFSGFNGANTLPVTAPMPFLGFPYNQIFSGFPMGNPFAAVVASNLVNAASSSDLNNIVNEQQTNFTEAPSYTQQAMMNGGGIMIQCEASPITYNGEQSSSPVHNDADDDNDAPVDLTERKSISTAAPLDLSKSETPKQVPRLPGSTNRRKGRAVKLDRRLLENDSDEEMPQEQTTVKPPVEANVYMQLKHLRTDMQHMFKHICRLQENLCTKQ